MTHLHKVIFFCLHIFLFGCFLCSCLSPNPQVSEADLSDFGEYVYRLDTTEMERTYGQLLAADTSNWHSDQVVRHRYDSLPFEERALWFDRRGISPDADSLVAHLRRQLPRCGLDSNAFHISQIAEDLQIAHSLAFDSLQIDINELLPRLDYNLSRAYVRYTAGQRYGFFRPNRILNNLDLKSSGEGFARLFDYDTQAPDYAESMQQLMSGERMDYLFESQPQGALFQQLSSRLLSTTDAAECHTLAVNIERCRWQMAQLPESGRRILVNIPAQRLWAIGPDSILTMRICCGATTTKTPLLHSSITHMQVNPDWIIPQNIVRNEVSRHAGDSVYFARNRYYIVDRRTGDTLQASHVSRALMESGHLRIGQHSGPGNSLGRIVFRFPNDFAIYLHDTNNPRAFQRNRRTLSHGCIRVENPFDLASFLLPETDEWTLDKIRLSMDLQPQSDKGKDYLKELSQREREDSTYTRPRPLRLVKHCDVRPSVPVFITYFTAYPDPIDASITFYPDLYGYDRLISKELQHLLIPAPNSSH
ncbi:MAG: L,D-transpeptidase family protein [Bacteroidaceae bacterium]|nr:L,D-transpeptidase family protein [Bacteroidaceae bacterium]